MDEMRRKGADKVGRQADGQTGVREKFPQRVLGAISNCPKLVWRLGDYLGWCFKFTLVLSP